MIGRISVHVFVLVAALSVCMVGCAARAKEKAPIGQHAEAEAPVVQAAPEPAAAIAAPVGESESAEPAEVSEAAAPAKHAKSAVTTAATITMTDQGFEPKTVTIRVGQAVRWNASTRAQSVTADRRLAKRKGSVSLPKGARSFNSGNMKPRATYTHVFTVAGTYKYFSMQQEKKGMVGEVIVEKKKASKSATGKKHATSTE